MKFVGRRFTACRSVLALGVGARSTIAQSVPVVPLSPGNGVLREEFSTLSARPVRELLDGRVLITETGSASRLVVADFKTNTVTSIGRKGRGPGEYTFGGGLYPRCMCSSPTMTESNAFRVIRGRNQIS